MGGVANDEESLNRAPPMPSLYPFFFLSCRGAIDLIDQLQRDSYGCVILGACKNYWFSTLAGVPLSKTR